MHRLLTGALILACGGAVVAGVGQVPGDDVFVLLRAIDDAAARQAWPGFRLTDWPLAVFDGTRTLLLRHPSPPPEFTPLAGPAGRHPLADGVRTVTIVGLNDAPKVERRDGHLVVEASGVRLTLRGAEASRAGDTVRIRATGGAGGREARNSPPKMVSTAGLSASALR